MVIEIGDKLVSTELFEKEFVCNLNACKGACCIEGDDGAPLKNDEAEQIEEEIEKILPFVSERGRTEINEKGVYYLDRENEPVTTLIDGQDCAFVFTDEDGIAKCGIESAYRAGKINFNKPRSCHLYPIRERKLYKHTALNYDRWSICSDACSLGKELGVPVYRFLKEPIIRVYGEEFFLALEEAASELDNLRDKEKGR